MRRFTLNLSLAALAAFVIHAGQLQAEPDEQTNKPRQESSEPQSNESGQRREYWIAVQCGPLEDPALRAQLGLERHEGIVVGDVLADGPAAKAGLKRYDVLVAAGGIRLRNVQVLLEAVNDSKGGELKVELYRDGKRQTVTVKPEGRPASPDELQAVMPERDRDALRRWVDSMRNGQPGPPPRAFNFIGPGFVMPQSGPTALPDNMSVTITRQGSRPAKIVVKQGDQTWETTEDKLSDLPAEVRRQVESMLGPRVVAPTQAPMVFGMPGHDMHQSLDQRLQGISDQLEQMRKRMDQLEERQEGERK